MPSNKPFPQPESYPAGFLTAIRTGGGVFIDSDLPWAPISAAKRFRQLLALVRKDPWHPLYPQAKHRWRVEAGVRSLTVTKLVGHGDVPSSSAPLIERALK